MACFSDEIQNIYLSSLLLKFWLFHVLLIYLDLRVKVTLYQSLETQNIFRNAYTFWFAWIFWALLF